MTGFLQWELEVSYLNQLIFGWLLGLWLAFVFAFIIRVPFYDYFKTLLEERQEISGLQKHIAVVVVLTTSMMLVCLVEYFIVKEEISSEIEDYLLHLEPLVKWCKGFAQDEFDKETLFFGVDVEYSSAFICILTGYLGIIYQRIYYKGQLFIELFPFDSKIKQFARYLGRFIVMSVLGGVVFFILAKILPIA